MISMGEMLIYRLTLVQMSIQNLELVLIQEFIIEVELQIDLRLQPCIRTHLTQEAVLWVTDKELALHRVGLQG